MDIDYEELNFFTQGYLDAMFATDGLGKDLHKLSARALSAIIIDCAGFQMLNQGLLDQAGTCTQNGYDFWMTRGQHEGGFWSRGHHEHLAAQLTEAACHPRYRRQLLVEGDDGLLYLI
jgi:hypothetical protein